MNIAVIGAGYVGLVSAACFADFGHSAVSVDNNASRIAALDRGEVPIYEPGLGEVIAGTVAARRLTFSTDLEAAVANSEVVLIAVGTPSRRGDGHADLAYVHAAARDIAAALRGFTVVVIKSTVPVGTGDAVEAVMRETNPAADFVLVSNPEFLREGAAIEDFRKPDRIVIGLNDERARPVMMALYAPLAPAPVLVTGRRTAELIKYASNAFLAMKVSFINELADLSEKAGADIADVSRGLGLDQRIAPRGLKPGPGYGGSCLPKDTHALVQSAREYGSPLRLVETTISINEERKRAMARKVIAACGGSVAGKTIAILGLTYTPNTDDLRESPTLVIVRALLDAGAQVRAYDPQGMPNARDIFPNIDLCDTPYDAADGAAAAVIVTEWQEFTEVDLARFKAELAAPVLVDLRNVFDRSTAERAGFAYHGVGR